MVHNKYLHVGVVPQKGTTSLVGIQKMMGGT